MTFKIILLYILSYKECNLTRLIYICIQIYYYYYLASVHIVSLAKLVKNICLLTLPPDGCA